MIISLCQLLCVDSIHTFIQVLQQHSKIASLDFVHSYFDYVLLQTLTRLSL